MHFRSKEEKAEELMERGFRLLDEYEPQKALKIAGKLKKIRHSSAFEIEALALADLDRKEEAVGILERGAEKAPAVWRLWQLLGNFLSDLERYEGAYAAYESALKGDDPDMPSISLNYAIAKAREGNLEGSRFILRPLLSEKVFETFEPGLRLRLIQTDMSNLNGLGQYKKAIEKFVALEGMDFGEGVETELSLLWGEYAFALFKTNKPDKALEAVFRAIHFDCMNKRAQWLVREIRREPQIEETNHYGLQIHGRWREFMNEGDDAPEGFYKSYQVLADSKDEALKFIREFEPLEIRDSLEISEVKFVERATNPKGVYSVSSYVFYSEDDSN